MRWSIIRLIWHRELRDQLRDRRTVLMIAVLTLFLYPILGIAVSTFLLGMTERQIILGIQGADYLPQLTARSAGLTPLPAATLIGFPPLTVGPELPLDRVLGPLALMRLQNSDYPPLLVNGQIASVYFDSLEDAHAFRVRLLDDADPGLLERKEVDLILTVPSDFTDRLLKDDRPSLLLVCRDDEHGRIVARRAAYLALGRWKQRLHEVRLFRQGLPANYNDDPFDLRDPERAKSSDRIAAEGLLDLMVRIFPFLLVMWSLAGALYPAVDICAGEKERGTMETLLISPASRQEIVLGKFLTIWVFSFATAMLNLVGMGLTAWHFSGVLTREPFGTLTVGWCILLTLPLSAFFSAVCLAIGAYARSTKEGQYYLLPLFLVTMPLVFLTLSPNVELNAFYSLVPVTGVALLMQRLMTAALDQVPWLYFFPVLLPIVLYSSLALRWAIEQFNREEVLFREAERLDVGLWLRRLFREKEPLPSVGQAFFCFGLIFLLRWLSAGIGLGLDLPVRLAVGYLAFVAAPPLFMVLLLTTHPQQGLLLRLPTLRSILGAVALAVLLLPPVSTMSVLMLEQFPEIKRALVEQNSMTEELRQLGLRNGLNWQVGLALVVLPAVCEELAFRGFILSGLRRRFLPWTAIVLSSFLFALYHMNVFQALPTFALGVVLGILVLRTGSLVPSMVFHWIHDTLVLGLVQLEAHVGPYEAVLQQYPELASLWLIVVGICAVLAAFLLWRLSAFGYHRWVKEDTALLPDEE